MLLSIYLSLFISSNSKNSTFTKYPVGVEHVILKRKTYTTKYLITKIEFTQNIQNLRNKYLYLNINSYNLKYTFKSQVKHLYHHH